LKARRAGLVEDIDDFAGPWIDDDDPIVDNRALSWEELLCSPRPWACNADGGVSLRLDDDQSIRAEADIGPVSLMK